MAQAEVDSVVAIIDRACEIVVAQAIAINVIRPVVFYEVDAYHSVVHSPADMVGHIVPRCTAVIINPIAVARRIAIRVAQETNLCARSIVCYSVPGGGYIHIALPRSFEGVSDIIIFVTACKCECGCCEEQHHHHSS